MIEAQGLTKYYGANKALDNFSFSVGKGEIVGIVGRNGAGKSTALRILSCQILPTEGTVTVDGLPVTEQPLEVRKRIGFLPETPPLYPEMSVRDFLRYAAGLRGMDDAGIHARLGTVLEETGLADRATDRIGNLSRGYQQRVGIAQAIIHDPPVVLLDEPMAGLDPLQITQIRNLIRALGERHTVLFSSHILSEITNVCDKVMVIDQGALRAEGTEEALWQTYLNRQQLHVEVRGGREALEAAVKSVPGVTLEAVTEAGEGNFSAILGSADDQREALSAALIKAGLGLRELRTEHHGLEELFMNLLARKGDA